MYRIGGPLWRRNLGTLRLLPIDNYFLPIHPFFVLMRRHLSSVILAAFILGVAGVGLASSAEARQVAWEAITLVFTFFTTPFILETTGAIVGVAIVLMINQRRLEKDRDEWVEMEVPVKPATPSVEKPLEAAVLKGS